MPSERSSRIPCPSCQTLNESDANFCDQCGDSLVAQAAPTPNPPGPAHVERERPMVVGFWMRCLSDALDGLVLGIVGFVLAISFSNTFYKWGEHGLWLGLAIAFLYTGILQSAIGNGQSLAKKILKIQVVGMDGSCLSLSRSFLRYSLLALTLYGGRLVETLTQTFPSLNHPWALTVMGALLGLLFVGTVFLVPFHPLKRGLHDLLADSLVVYEGTYNAERLNALNNPQKIKNAYRGVGLLVGSLAALLMVVGVRVLRDMSFTRDLQAVQSIQGKTHLTNVAIQNWTLARPDRQRVRFLVVRGFLAADAFDNAVVSEQEAQAAVRALLQSYGDVRGFDHVSVALNSGFNLGIYSVRKTKTYRFSVDGQELARPPQHQ